MAEVEKKFDAALAIIKSLPEKGPYRPPNETLLTFYGYFKQAMKGNNTTSQPWSFDIVAKAKWDAWKKNHGLTKEEAMQGYVDALVKIIEDIPESEKQNLVSLDKRNVLQEFLTLVYGTTDQQTYIESEDMVTDECTSLKSDDEYWDAERVDSDAMEDTVIQVENDAIELQSKLSSNDKDVIVTEGNEFDSEERSATVSTKVDLTAEIDKECSQDSKKAFNEVDNVNDVCKNNEESISLSEFQNTFNSALGKLQQDINNVIVAVTRLEEALKVSSERQSKSKQDLQPARRAIEVSTSYRHFLKWNWKWAVFLVIWPFISQIILHKLRRKKR